MNTFFQDLRYSLRLLGSRPAFTLVAVATLALGIGATTAIFSVVNAVLINPLPYREPEQLLQFWETNPLKNWTQATVAPANLFDWQEQNVSFDDIAAYMGSDKKGPGLAGMELTEGAEPERLQGLYVTGNLFSVLDARAMLGRTLTEEETWQGKHMVVVLSHGLWQRRFGADPQIVGKTIQLNGQKREVVGVMPAEFYFPSKEAEMWVPMGWNRGQVSQLRRPHFLRAVGRLKPGVTLAQAQAEMTGIAGGLEARYPDTNTQMGVGIGPLKDWIVADVQFSLVVLLAAVGFVLLIACVNVANLLLARAAARSREVAIRVALGARRARVVRQLMTESLLLAFLGGTAGLLLAIWGTDLLVAFSPSDIPRLDELRLDWRVLGFTVAATLLTTLLTGLAPALQSTNPQLTTTLKEGGQKGSSGRGNRLRAGLVVAEVALAVVLTAGAGLMIRSFIRLQEVDPGFDPNPVLTLRVSLPGARYPEDANAQAFFKQAEERLRRLPGVEAVGSTTRLPLKGYPWTGDMTVEGQSPEDYLRELRHKEVTPDYFRAMGLPLLEGRFFNEADNDKGQPVTIVNAALARLCFPGESAVGKRVKFVKPDRDGVWQTIVGVVGDEKQDGLRAPVKPEAFQSYLQRADSDMTIVVRTTIAPEAMAAAARQEIRSLDPSLPVYDVKAMPEVVAESLTRERFLTLLLVAFAFLALTLASIGIYGVMSYTVAQRTQEIGIRIALGAQNAQILRLVVGRGMTLAVSGAAIGLAAAFALTRLMSVLLFDVSATDPVTFAGVTAALLLVAFFACFVPARRAAKTDPIIALRCD